MVRIRDGLDTDLTGRSEVIYPNKQATCTLQLPLWQRDEIIEYAGIISLAQYIGSKPQNNIYEHIVSMFQLLILDRFVPAAYNIDGQRLARRKYTEKLYIVLSERCR